MSDIRDLGSTGRAVFDTAQRLKGASLISDAQLQELTNAKVGPQDVAIGNQALDRLQASTPDAMKLLGDIPRMNQNILALQKDALERNVGAAEKAAQQAAPGFVERFMKAIDSGARWMHDKQIEAIRNIR